MSLIFNEALIGAAGQGGAYEIEQSLRLNKADSPYVTKVFSSAGDEQSFTLSFWFKICHIGKSVADNLAGAGHDGNNYFNIDIEKTSVGEFLHIFNYTPAHGYEFDFKTNRLIRDPSAWMHLVLAVDTTQATASNRVKIWLNGVQETSFATESYPAQNRSNLWWGGNTTNGVALSSQETSIGRRPSSGAEYANAYIAEVNSIDGQYLTHEDFGEFDDNGVWRPIKYTGTYTGNSFYLKFDAADVDGDSSGLGNDFTANNITTSGTGTDVMSDTPTNNFATLNPIEPASASAGTLSDGNLYIANQDYSLQKATFRFGGGGPTTGKYYWEVTHTGGNYTSYTGVTSNLTQDAGEIAGGQDKSWFGNNSTRQFTSGSSGSYTHTYSSGDVHGYAIDLDAQEIKYYINGTLKFTDSTLPDPATTVLVPFQFTTNSGSGYSWTNTSWNFGQRAFSHQPTGYSSLCTANLPAPEIADGSQYFNTALWTGNGSSQSITGVGFQPDFLWAKARNQSYWHRLHDAVRGRLISLYSNESNAEASQANSITSFDSDGFTLGSDGSHNGSGVTYVGWSWLAGNGTSSNTNGSITSTVSANPSAGFSIVTYTAENAVRTIGHGLGVAPKLIIVKNRDATQNWAVYHGSLGATKGLYLDLSTKQETNSGYWNNTEPTSTVFTVGTNTRTGGTTNNYVAYCFAEIDGYSRMGSYSANASTDGPFIYCGFRPAFIFIKNYAGGSESPWVIYDDVRDTYNVAQKRLFPDLPATEESDSTRGIDIVSNGFKIRNNHNSVNESGCLFVFWAVAENPFGGDGVSPATAR